MGNIFKRLFESASRKSSTSNCGKNRTRRMTFEHLEDRQLLAVTTGLPETLPVDQPVQAAYEASELPEDLAIALADSTAYVVDTTEDIVDPDDGVLSLREAIAYAKDGERVEFSPSLGDDFVITINSELGALVLSKGVTIAGEGRVALDGGQHHIMDITGGSTTCRVTIDGVTFQNANAFYTASSSKIDGGALYVSSAAYVEIGNSVFRNNATQSDGGAIANTGNLILNNVEFYNNTASYGGAITLTYGTLTANNLVFHDNHARTHGGAIYSALRSNATFYGSVFYSNTAVYNGGAIYRDNGYLSVYRGLFYGNRAVSGGAVYDKYQSHYSVFSNCTIAGNIANRGGGIYVNNSGLSLYNSIVTDNFAYDVKNVLGETYENLNNAIDDEAVFIEGPKFTANGVLTNIKTLALRGRSDSALIDAGSSDLTAGEYDAFGNPRVQGDAVDIGAFEYIPVADPHEAAISGKVRIDTTLTASAVGETSGEPRYYWYVSDTADGEQTLIEGANKNTYKAPKEYIGKYLTVAVVDTANTYAAKTTVGPLEKAKLCKRTVDSVANSNSVYLSWKPVPNADRYEVRYRLAGTNDRWSAASVATSAYTISGLSPDTAYEFSVQAYSYYESNYYADGDRSYLTVKTLPAREEVVEYGPVKALCVTKLRYNYVQMSFIPNGLTQTYRCNIYTADRTQLVDSFERSSIWASSKKLSPSTAYVADIIPLSDSYGEGPVSSIEFTTPGNKLPVPTVSVASTTDLTAELQWDAVPNAEGYLVSYKADGDSEYTTVGTFTDVTSCTVEDLDPDTIYRFRVKALGDGNTCSNSDSGVVYGMTQYYASETAYAPTHINVGTITSTSVQLSWWGAYKANVFVLVGETAAGESIPIQQAQSTSATITGLKPNTTYTFEVYSHSTAYGRSPNCESVTVTTAPAVKKLARPVVIVEDTAEEGTVKVSWNAVNGASSYRLQFRKADDSAASWVTYDNISANSGKITGLEPNTRYLVRVRANGNDSEYSNSDNALVEFFVGTVETELTASL